jgi:ABC-type uncharacterized transport system ATPase subunit
MVEEIAESVSEEVQKETEEEIKETPAVKVPEFKKPLDKMTAIELREVAMEIPGVAGVHARKKEELLSVIKEYYAIEDETPRKGREHREPVRAASDRKQADILRRRINRLKKQTRKAAQG